MPAEHLILAFDTSAAHCAAALLRGEAVLAARVEEMSKGQAERLMPLLEELLAEAGLAWRNLAAIGVGIGPGNFTGVRISVAAARGLALSLAIPAIGVSTLEAMAEGAERPLSVVLDARRGEVYAQHFTAAGPEAPQLIAREALPEAPQREGIAPEALVIAVARLAAQRMGSPQPRPAPLYLRGADAAPPADPPPVILE